MTTDEVRELAIWLRGMGGAEVFTRQVCKAADILERLADDAKEAECVKAWATWGRAGAGMALADYRKYVMGQ